MKSVMLCLVTILVFLLPHSVLAKEDENLIAQTWQELEELSDQSYQFANNGQYGQIDDLLKSFNKKWSMLVDMTPIPDLDQRIITSSLDQARQTIKSDISEKQKNRNVVQLRLAVDAIESDSNPMWKILTPKVMKYANQMQNSVEKKDWTHFQHQLNQFLDQYQTIYPAMMIDQNSNQVQQVNEKVDQLSNNRMTIRQDKDSVKKLNQLREDLQVVFNQKTQQSHSQIEWIPIIYISGGIFITLLLVSKLRRSRKAIKEVVQKVTK
ncbi:sporulation protein YpjB [Terrilactibacillus laevilacticus]|uniref:Sporulation protein YpjB n=1 Tax=Terrilactibacillus laevilacticus TaxID=1380157 RepID=A0ABW5PRX3_9BACI|nr:sporulation protein YpjB [Terrilactibacillus laevilacticus]